MRTISSSQNGEMTKSLSCNLSDLHIGVMAHTHAAFSDVVRILVECTA